MDPARIPLGEDWELRGMPPLHHIHATYKWNETNTIKYSAMSQVCVIYASQSYSSKKLLSIQVSRESRIIFQKVPSIGAEPSI